VVQPFGRDIRGECARPLKLHSLREVDTDTPGRADDEDGVVVAH
jgi:hypothetical protein